MEAVADVAHGLDEGVAAVFDLAAETPDVDIDSPPAAVEIVTPDAAEQHLAGADLVLVKRQEPEQFVLLVGELDRPVTNEGFIAVLVDREVAAVDLVRLLVVGSLLNSSLDAGDNLFRDFTCREIATDIPRAARPIFFR